jgi:hypothetical protein
MSPPWVRIPLSPPVAPAHSGRIDARHIGEPSFRFGVQVLVLFRLLQERQAGTIFAASCLPPLASGTTWSMERLSSKPQYAQVWL